MTEHQMYEQIARYLQLQYPYVVYRFDLAADMKLTVGQAAKHKRLHPRRGYPDLFIAEARPRPKYIDENGERPYYGLFLELKKDGTRIKKKDGSWASDHIREQAEMLTMLELRGYSGRFAVGFDEAVDIIDKYLGGEE